MCSFTTLVLRTQEVITKQIEEKKNYHLWTILCARLVDFLLCHVEKQVCFNWMLCNVTIWKVEEAVALAMAQNRRPSSLKYGASGLKRLNCYDFLFCLRGEAYTWIWDHEAQLDFELHQFLLIYV